MQCTVLYCRAVHCNVLQSSALKCIIAVQCTVIYLSAMQCRAVQYSALHCNAVRCSVNQLNKLYCIEVHYIPVVCTVLLNTALDDTTQHSDISLPPSFQARLKQPRLRGWGNKLTKGVDPLVKALQLCCTIFLLDNPPPPNSTLL